jgi:hypothetical protein
MRDKRLDSAEPPPERAAMTPLPPGPVNDLLIDAFHAPRGVGCQRRVNRYRERPSDSGWGFSLPLFGSFGVILEPTTHEGGMDFTIEPALSPSALKQLGCLLAPIPAAWRTPEITRQHRGGQQLLTLIGAECDEFLKRQIRIDLRKVIEKHLIKNNSGSHRPPTILTMDPAVS